MSATKNFLLTNKTAVVTGAAGRLGPKFAEALAEAGANVVLGDINEKEGRKIARELAQRFRSRIVFHPLDVTEKRSIQALAAFTVKKFKTIDILLNGAMSVGKDFYAPLESYLPQDWDWVMKVNVGGTFFCSQVIGTVMKRQGSGAIINIGSIYGVVGADQRIYGDSKINSPAVYAASKGAIISLTRYLAVYWASSGIRVNSISPGGVFSNQAPGFIKKYSERTPMGRMLDKNELKGAVVFLASPASSYVTGHNLMVDGGWTAW
jgi:NAD(P)-dependent dehydrogenase (short-subunit alcohol dehydrogenase family)